MSQQPSTEFFRHLRPLWFDARRAELRPHPQGGISFLLRPVAPRTYQFWLTICPLDTTFSARQAVLTLRRAASVAAPWGELELAAGPLLPQLVARAAATDLPSEVGHLLRHLTTVNELARRRAAAAAARAYNARLAAERGENEAS